MQAVGLTKRFGGLAAVSEVSLDLWRGRIHAVIGPNGASKSTLTNLLSGDLAPTAGSVSLLGHSMTGKSPQAYSKAGLGRSYQKTNVFLPFTVWENTRLAAQSRQQQAARWWGSIHSKSATTRAVNERAQAAIERAGLAARAQATAGTISHGEQRQLEIAMTLATQPQVLLLDEPLAGMGAAEAQRMVELLLQLKADHALLLVEHDMEAVFAVADHLSVMVNGCVIASGLPGVVRADPTVQAAYLGEDVPPARLGSHAAAGELGSAHG